MTDVSVTTHVFDAAVDLFEVRDDRTEGTRTPPTRTWSVRSVASPPRLSSERSNDTRTSSACRCP